VLPGDAAWADGEPERAAPAQAGVVPRITVRAVAAAPVPAALSAATGKV
jgi:hypothetical protein